MDEMLTEFLREKDFCVVKCRWCWKFFRKKPEHLFCPMATGKYFFEDGCNFEIVEPAMPFLCQKCRQCGAERALKRKGLMVSYVAVNDEGSDDGSRPTNLPNYREKL